MGGKYRRSSKVGDIDGEFRGDTIQVEGALGEYGSSFYIPRAQKWDRSHA